MSANIKVWDVIVIGGGPAGMMAAGSAAARGKAVLLLEKNASLGRKLLITGGGRCNLTNHKLEISTLISSYKHSPKALYSTFTQFGVEDTLNFFHSRGMETKVEAEDRVFPLSNRAESVWQVLVDYIRETKVTVKSNTTVTKLSLVPSTGSIEVHTKDGRIIGKSCIVATGGTSRPETGSTGDGYKWLEQLGHTIVENNFALVPVALKDPWVRDLAGVTLQDIKITILQDGKKQESRIGKLLFTHLGITGPSILNMSSKIGDILQYGPVIVELDLLPAMDLGQMKIALNNLILAETNKKLKNILNKLIPAALVRIVLNTAGVDGENINNQVTREDRIKLIATIKGLRMNVKGLLGADKAIVSAGGVEIDEVNFKTMESRLIPNLYIVGDVLNIDRPSGGYSLQICWATGYVAGIVANPYK